ncbi:MAG: hypothetical protein AAGF36_14080 [Pseudomonadota bacterium]
MRNEGGTGVMQNAPIIGIISPPDWFDPSVDEFRSLCASDVRMQQTMVSRAGLNYDDLNDIAAAAPDVADAARLLGHAGARVIGMTGTPFVWAGLSSRSDILDRQARIAAAAGCDVCMAGTALVDALRALGARQIAVAAPYYTERWCAQTRLALSTFGFDVLSIASADRLSGRDKIGGIADHHKASDMATVRHLLESLREDAPEADAMVVAGAGVRMLNATPEFEAALGCPVVSSDTALYFAVMQASGLRPRPGLLGWMADALR